MSAIRSIDKEIAKAKFLLSQKKDDLDKIARKLELTEREKIYLGRETELIQVVNSLIAECKKDMAVTLGKIPPHATDLEESVIGALLLEKDAFDKVKSFLKPEHFYSEAHTEIYKAVIALASGNNPVDMRTVVNHLREKGTIELVGGSYYIAELTSKVASAASIEYHARVLVEKAIKRRAITIGAELLHRGYDDKDCFEMIEYAEDEINGIREWLKK